MNNQDDRTIFADGARLTGVDDADSTNWLGRTIGIACLIAAGVMLAWMVLNQ